jgi:hypothetical protein
MVCQLALFLKVPNLGSAPPHGRAGDRAGGLQLQSD